MSAPSVQQQQKTVGNATLQDNHGKELNLYGTPKAPYRHPNFGHAQPIVENRDTLPLQLVNQEIQNMAIGDMGNNEEGDRQGIHQRNRALVQQNDTRRNSPAVKPAKMNIPEFEGLDADSWIQVIEQYFDAARTPLEQRTEIATTYLKGPAIQWW